MRSEQAIAVATHLGLDPSLVHSVTVAAPKVNANHYDEDKYHADDRGEELDSEGSHDAAETPDGEFACKIDDHHPGKLSDTVEDDRHPSNPKTGKVHRVRFSRIVLPG